MTRTSLPILLSLVLAIPAYAKITEQDGNYVVKKCNLRPGAPFSLYIQGSGFRDSGVVDSTGCATKEYRVNSHGLHPGSTVVQVTVNGVTSEVEWAASATGGSSTTTVPTTGGNRGGSAGSTTTVTQPPAPVLPSANLEQVAERARNQARMSANRVVKNFGAAENFRYNVYAGINTGAAVSNLVMGDIRETGSYRQGQRDGMSSGQNDGLNAGRSAGSSQGFAAGGTTAYDRFSAVVDQSMSPDLGVNAPSVNSGGWDANISQPASIPARIQQASADVDNLLAQQNFEFEGWSYDRGYWSQHRLAYADAWTNGQYQYNLVGSWYRSEWAWQTWSNGGFADDSRRDQAYYAALTYFQKISDPNQTSNYDSARSIFINTFKAEYDRVLDEKWQAAVSQPNQNAQLLGQAIGARIYREYATDTGRYEGYLSSYRSATAHGYNESYPGAFVNGFNNKANYLSSHMSLAGASATIDSEYGGDFFLPGAGLNVTVNSLKNVGRLGGHVPVKMGGTFTPGFDGKGLELGAASSLKQPARIEWAGKIDMNVPANVGNYATVWIGDQQVGVNFTVWIENVVYAAATSKYADMYAGYIYNQLASEWQQKRTAGANYYNPGGESLLAKVVSKYYSMNPAQKAGIAKYRENFRSAFGKRPGAFERGKDSWDKAKQLIDQLQ